MPIEKRNFAVNWQDGMKVHTDHFIALENWVGDSIRDAICLNNHSYGILPPSPGADSSLKIQCEPLPGNEIRVMLLACKAVTAGGILFERREEENTISGIQAIESKLKITSGSKEKLNVIISVDRTTRCAIVDPDPDENPPRRPFVIPKYIIKILSEGVPYNSNYELKIGEIIFEGEAPVVSKEYIPPCVSLNSYALLIDKYQYFKNLLNEIHINSMTVFQRLRTGLTFEGINELARDSLHFFSEQITVFLANTLSWYNVALPQLSPLFWIEFFMRFARVIHTTLGSMDDGAKHILLTSFRNWGSDFIPADFEDSLNSLISSDYDHENIQKFIKIIHKMIEPLTNTYRKLPKRDFTKLRTGIVQEIKKR